jgi:hypothetical protein
MDPIAITAATLVAKWAAEGFVKEAAKSAWSGLQGLYNTLRSGIAGNPDASESLRHLEEKPTSQDRTLEFAKTLSKCIESNPEFRRELQAAIDQAGELSSLGVFVTSVRDNAKVGKITTIGNVEGDVRF